MYIRFIQNQMTFQFSFWIIFLKYGIVLSVVGPGVLKL